MLFFAIFGVSAIYGSPLNWSFPTTKSQAIAGLSSAADVLKADLKAITGPSARGEERSAIGDPSLPRFQRHSLTVRLEPALSASTEQVWISSASASTKIPPPDLPILRRGSIKLEKKAALPATPASESADVVARLDKLEKKRSPVAAAPASRNCWSHDKASNQVGEASRRRGRKFGQSPPPAAPKQSSLMARAEPSASNGNSEIRRPRARAPRL